MNGFCRLNCPEKMSSLDTQSWITDILFSSSQSLPLRKPKFLSKNSHQETLDTVDGGRAPYMKGLELTTKLNPNNLMPTVGPPFFSHKQFQHRRLSASYTTDKIFNFSSLSILYKLASF